MLQKKLRITFVLGLIFLFSLACNLPGFSGQPTLDIIAVQQAQNTIVVEMTQTANAAAGTPSPVETAEPGTAEVDGTQAVPITAPTAAAEPVFVHVTVDTNCRFGPHLVYDYLGAVMKGESTEVLGKHPEQRWLLVKNPDRENQSCWMTMQYAELDGDLDVVPVVEPPPFYDWNGTWVYMQFQIDVDVNLPLVQNGKTVTGSAPVSGGHTLFLSGTLSENGRLLSGEFNLNTSPPISWPVYIEMLENMDQFRGVSDNPDFSQFISICGYRNGAGYLSECPLP